MKSFKRHQLNIHFKTKDIVSNFFAKLRTLVRAHVLVVADNLAESTIFLHEWKFLGEARRHSIAERRRRYEQLFRHVIEQGIASGDFTPTDPKMATLLVLSAVNWLPQWYNPSGPLSPEEIADSFCDLVLAGIKDVSPGKALLPAS